MLSSSHCSTLVISLTWTKTVRILELFERPSLSSKRELIQIFQWDTKVVALISTVLLHRKVPSDWIKRQRVFEKWRTLSWYIKAKGWRLALISPPFKCWDGWTAWLTWAGLEPVASTRGARKSRRLLGCATSRLLQMPILWPIWPIYGL